jgi:2,3-bisphosphoglycerate-independent phosphoglycerate mutase
MRKLSALMMLLCLTVILSACASSMKKEEKMAQQDEKKPVNCATAEGDIRALKSEKVHAAQQLEAGITAVVPIGLVAGVATGTEGIKAQMATGEYNKKLDEKITEIKIQCGLE